MVNIALLGAGVMGRNYLTHIKEGRVPSMHIAAAVARSSANQNLIQEICGDDVLICASEDELYQHTDLFDAVIITTPHKLHPAMAIRALKDGKHVLLDKPMGISVGECSELIACAKESDRVFSVVFHQRAFPVFMRIKEILDSGELGTIRRVLLENSRYFRTEHYHRSSPWRSSWNGEGGGLMINQAQHILDIWQWLFGMPETVYASIGFGKYNDFLVDDEAILQMSYPDGKSGTFILSTGEGTDQERLEIVGSKGTAFLNKNHLSVHTYSVDLDSYRKDAESNSREGFTETVREETLGAEQSTYPVILENFARAIETGEPLIVDGLDAINALELTNAAYLSAWHNAPVKLPIDAGIYESELEAHRRMESEKQ